MEDSLLNKAHLEAKQAVKYQSKGQYTQAVQHHLSAASLFNEIRETLPEDNTLTNSLLYFSQYHQRQAELNEKIQEVCKNLEKIQKSKMEKKVLEARYSATTSSSSGSQYQRQNYKSYDEEPDSLYPGGGTVVLTQLPANNNFMIRPRSNAEVNEEYQIIISNLRLLVDKQAKELNEYREQIKQYQNKIQELTTKLEVYESSSSASASSASVSASVMMRSIYDPRELPELPPLEGPPECDFLL